MTDPPRNHNNIVFPSVYEVDFHCQYNVLTSVCIPYKQNSKSKPSPHLCPGLNVKSKPVFVIPGDFFPKTYA